MNNDEREYLNLVTDLLQLILTRKMVHRPIRLKALEVELLTQKLLGSMNSAAFFEEQVQFTDGV